MLMLLAFVGQGVAAAIIPCQMDMQTSSDVMDLDHTGHNLKMNALDQNVDSSEIDCTLNCNCPMATCLSALIPTSLVLNPEPVPTLKFSSTITKSIEQGPNSLYRPPITR